MKAALLVEVPKMAALLLEVEVLEPPLLLEVELLEVAVELAPAVEPPRR